MLHTYVLSEAYQFSLNAALHMNGAPTLMTCVVRSLLDEMFQNSWLVRHCRTRSPAESSGLARLDFSFADS